MKIRILIKLSLVQNTVLSETFVKETVQKIDQRNHFLAPLENLKIVNTVSQLLNTHLSQL